MFTNPLHHVPQRPAGLWDGIHDGLDYWLGQQDVGRGGEPRGFDVVGLFRVEWPVLALGAVGAVFALRPADRTAPSS